ncbi:hypothetical protein PBI_DEWDROP_50 [Microbacterium phage Dewdrop]|nr:hypothetical protein PBI_LEAF_50 [Microbacterium phage Leaf]QGZ17419.1 hypothetical protein PBI_DEWDROP_50 [Microbacterium phage Dewdrop]
MNGAAPAAYQKLPVVVHAVQWQGDNLEVVQQFVGIMTNMDGDASTVRFEPPGAVDDEGEVIWDDGLAHLWVEANLAWLPIELGEWILKDRLGFYPCKDEMFQTTYREADL